ncbi:hypothetical protein [Streptomyces hygroscopicus]|uniref:hypothetical protein n=1 Tax=Streptomyces hygroscopicus TaxID=1912 RepID=UPI00223F8364|nr:hypothetical protein [Streptomyces hygroscopicus]
MTPDRHGLGVYLQSVNEEVQTLKMSSELWFRSPPLHEINVNDRFVRSLVGAGLEWTASASTACGEHAESQPDRLWSKYWDAATHSRDIAVHFGAPGHRTLREYFTVDTGRSGEVALARARRTVTAHSPADYLLQTIDRVSAATGAAPAQSCRRVMSLLSRDWPRSVPAHQDPSGAALTASQVLREFRDSVEARTSARRRPHRASPDPGTGPNPGTGGPSVLLTAAEARELASSYMLGRFCFTAQECLMAMRLVGTPRLQAALLAVQLQLTAGSLGPLDRLVTAFGTPRALLPFTEAFVNRHGYGSSRLSLSPNPKLITVLCNNVVPAIAGELLRKGAHAEDLDADTVRAGVVAARRRHVFEILIALFDRVDGPDPNTVQLSGFSMRVCPALVPFTAFLETWLPYHFARLPRGGPAPLERKIGDV